ncbi:hypothetical protein PRZ48_010930 [Zasmidium cellare]|uniref:N-acetyltransferase domain-containing protein n=1 Tax=Zasmidium cellare TaxID=395010 RepID=A0ABR0EA12_ZASCE|nr:hypothetical protein PRZ48_010930 [Zasmidium cellare]
MPNPNITITPLNHPSETPTYIHTFTTSFSTPSAEMLTPLIYRTDLLSPPVQTHFLATFDPPSPTNRLYLAKDTTTDEVLGCSGWELFNPDEADSRDVEERLKAYLAKAEEHAAPPELRRNDELRRAAITAMFRARASLPRPFVELAMLAVHPDHQGKGVGSALLKDGLRWVDELGVPAFVVSSGQGRGLYKRYGFEEEWDFGLDAREFGGEREGRHWCMLRRART